MGRRPKKGTQFVFGDGSPCFFQRFQYIRILHIQGDSHFSENDIVIELRFG
jgi:hypothetical protein